MCSSPKLFAAYHVLHRLIVPRHPSCALSSLTTKKTFAPGTLPHSGLSLLLFLSTKKLFLFLQILFQDTFFDCQSTPRSPAALPLLPQRKSFLIKSVCRTGGFVGESFSPTPPFPLCAGLSFPVGCALSVRPPAMSRGPLALRHLCLRVRYFLFKAGVSTRYTRSSGGVEGTRTLNILLAKQVL